MPHWKGGGPLACIAGTPGAEPPAPLRPAGGERVFSKQFFSAFSAAGLTGALRELGSDTLVIAGLYLHACVRASALDAYERGFTVWIADEASGSTEPVHAELTRLYLAARAARFAGNDALLRAFGQKSQPLDADTPQAPVAWLEGRWVEATEHERLLHRRPADTREIVAAVPLAGAADVHAAAEACDGALRAWRQRGRGQRLELLRRWSEQLAVREDELVGLLVREIGKPAAEARGEFARALNHIDTAVRCIEAAALRNLAPGVSVRQAPLGTVALLTPWNNPVAIPVGKLAPALGFGNTVLWKPAHQAPGCARVVAECLAAAGLPPGVVNLVFGEAETARQIIAHARIAAVAVTGSHATGCSAAALCSHFQKPLQAELGGNNAAIVLRDADLEAEAVGLAAAAFGFAGQRCTATRRFVVERTVAEPFTRALQNAVAALRVGDPATEGTQVGPLISLAARAQALAVLEQARAEGGRVLCGGAVPAGLEAGAYLAPALVAGLAPDARLVQEETFGPVAVIQLAEDLGEAIGLANGVRQGLVAGLATRDPAALRRFVEEVEAGIVKLTPGALPVHAEAPFGGWKASGIGPPEHGAWDREFYSRPQALYGDAPFDDL
jgi:acyl-CoA reductase-like NAD-dependent aldehyde dehydrogenase